VADNKILRVDLQFSATSASAPPQPAQFTPLWNGAPVFSRTGASVRSMPVGKRRSSPSANQPVGVLCSVLLVTRRGGFGQRRKLGGAGRENPHRKGSRRSSACCSAALGNWRAGRGRR